MPSLKRILNPLKLTLLSGLVLFLSLSVSTLQAQPAISIPAAEFDFGHTIQHAKVCHRFMIYSTGTDTLRIEKVVLDCGCTKAPLEDSVLAPGDSTWLDLFFSTRSYRGTVKKRPYLMTNAGPEKTYLKFSSFLIPEPEIDLPVRLSPPKIDVSQFKEKPRRRASTWVVNPDVHDYNLSLINHAEYVFEVRMPEIVKAGDSAKIRIQILEEMVGQEFEYSLTFKVNDSSGTHYTVPVKRLLRIKDRSN